MVKNFATAPANIMPGIQAFTGAVESYGQFQLNKAKRGKAEQLKRKASELIGQDPEVIAKEVAKNPELREIMKNALGAENDAMLDMSKKYLIEQNDPFELHEAEARRDIVEGRDPSGNIEMARAMLSEKTKGEATKKHETVLMLNDPKAYKSYMAQKGGVVDKKGKKLKLEQLINKRNELPEGSGDRKIYEQAIAKEVAAPGQAKSHPFISKLMAEGWMPSGRITGPMLAAFEAAAQKAHEMGKDLTVDDLRKMEFQAVKNRSTGSAAGSRLVLARKQGIESAQGLLKDMKVTAHKLNYSPVKFIGALQKYKKDQTGDPLFVEYMTQRADSLFILGNVLKQNGLTDKSIEVEEEAASPTLAPKAFDAWLNTQTRALNRAAKEMNTDYGYGITLLPAFDAGQAGAPTDEQPTPVIPPKGGHGQPAGQPKYKEGQTANGGKAIFSGGVWRDNI